MAKKKNVYNYFDGFVTMANYANEAAVYLNEVINNFDANPEVMLEKVNGIHEIEHNADAKRHEVINRLTTEFMTPIEREDIMEMIQQLDNVVDHIDDVMRTIYMYDIQKLSDATISFAALLVKITEALKGAMEEFEGFRKSKTIKSKIIAVSDIEDEGDILHLDTLHALYRSDASAVEIIRNNKLIDGMEDCLDACADVVDIVERVILKNS